MNASRPTTHSAPMRAPRRTWARCQIDVPRADDDLVLEIGRGVHACGRVDHARSLPFMRAPYRLAPERTFSQRYLPFVVLDPVGPGFRAISKGDLRSMNCRRHARYP